MGPSLIAFPEAAVDTAIAELRRVASHLDSVATSIDSAAVRARTDWSGGHRDDFDVIESALVHRHGDLAIELRNLMAELVDAKAAVRAENRRRTEAWEEAQASACDAPPGPGGGPLRC